jgi:acetylornithine/N-succinyldiaminopimelate aminotransferase
MPDISSDPPNSPLEPVLPLETSAPTTPLDFSGRFVAAPEKSTESAPPTEKQIPVSPLASETAALCHALCAKLLPTTFGDRAFLLPSEADAWKFAVETIRRYHRVVGRPKRRRFIICMGDADEKGGKPPGLEGDNEITLLRSDHLGMLQAEISVKTAGIVIAPVRTSVGLEVISGSLLARLREIADEYGLVMVFDESVCGLGRSGMLWAHAWTGLTPDLMIITLGFTPSSALAALVVTQRIARGLPGSPLMADQAALLAGLDILDAVLSPGFEEQVQSRGWYLEDRLTPLLYKHRDAFTGLCGIGLMQGLVCSGGVEPLRANLAKRGFLTRAMGSVLGLLPPLTVSESEIDAAVSFIDRICAEGEY